MKNKLNFIPLYICINLLNAFQNINAQQALQTLMSQAEFIKGKEKYLETPFVTAGNRLYMVGNQSGQFPDLGWHVEGEMGGIWDHPIKLMDGFSASVSINNRQICLDKANEFINYPFANKHIYTNISEGLDIERFQFVPDNKEGMVVEYTFINKNNSPIEIQFEWTGHTDLRPVWLGERTNMIDAPDKAKWDAQNYAWLAKDDKNNWFVMFGANVRAVQHHQNSACPFVSQGQTCSASLVYEIIVPANGKMQLPFTIAGSFQSAVLAKKTFTDIQKNAFSYLNSKILRYQKIEQTSSVTLPDKKIEQAFRWLKYNTDWLVKNVPNVGNGVTAGLPDYPWWFSADGYYTLAGLIALGEKQICYDEVELLNDVSEKENGNGRIIHEVSTNGSVYNKGNLNEVPQFASMVCEIYRWTGDKYFLQKYFPTIKKGMKWLLDENDKDNDLVADGFGMMEIHGLNSEMIDVAVYSQKAFADISYMALELGDSKLAKEYQDKAEILKKKINRDFWVAESGSYADFIGTKTEALSLIKDALVRADTLNKPLAIKELKATQNSVLKLPDNTKKGFVIYHNWVVNTPMETGVAEPEKAKIALKTARKSTNPFGVFVTGIDRDENAGNEDSDFALKSKHFTYTGAVMTLPTAVSVIGENNYGNTDESLAYLNKMTKTFSYALPGSMYEISPDYGMCVQAWNLYGYAVPIIKQFFGLKPNAAHKTVSIQPAMPTTWENAKIEKVKVGNNELNFNYEKIKDELHLTISQNQADWKVILSFPKGKYKNWYVNDKKVVIKCNGTMDFVELKGMLLNIRLQ